MLKEAKKQGFISAHSSPNYKNRNAIDISYKNMKPAEYKKLRAAAEKPSYISYIAGKEENDPVLHLEIPTKTSFDQEFIKETQNLYFQLENHKISEDEFNGKISLLIQLYEQGEDFNHIIEHD